MIGVCGQSITLRVEQEIMSHYAIQLSFNFSCVTLQTIDECGKQSLLGSLQVPIKHQGRRQPKPTGTNPANQRCRTID